MTRLAVTTLVLNHVRSHASARIEVDAGPIAIHGANGSGKTNILEAVSLLSPGRGLRRANATDIARSPGEIGWKVRATLESLHQIHEVETWLDPGATSRALRIDGKTQPQTVLGRIARVLWLVPSMDRLWLDGAGERRRFLDRIAMSLEPGHADATISYEKAMRERNRLLKDQIRDSSWYVGLEAQMAEHGSRIAANRRLALERLTAAQRSAETAFPVADLSLLMPENTDTVTDIDDLRVALANGRARDMSAGRTLVGPHRADLGAVYAAKAMEARHCSTGEQKALLVSLILANARAIAEDFGAPPVVLLDEVAAHLDADRRADLFNEICALGVQAWMTGTGPELFETLGDRGQFLEVRERDGQSSVTPDGPR